MLIVPNAPRTACRTPGFVRVLIVSPGTAHVQGAARAVTAAGFSVLSLPAGAPRRCGCAVTLTSNSLEAARSSRHDRFIGIRIQCLCIDTADPAGIASFWNPRWAGAVRGRRKTRSASSRRKAARKMASLPTLCSSRFLKARLSRTGSTWIFAPPTSPPKSPG